MAEAAEPVENIENGSENIQDRYESDDSFLFNTTFDTTLSTSHLYLGNDLEVLRGRTLLDNGIYLNLLLWPPEGTWLILFPGETLPIVERNSNTIKVLREILEKDRIFGIACVRKENGIGTTAEMYEYREDTYRGFTDVRMKAKGRQRFKIIRIKHNEVGIPFADVQILPETDLGPLFFQERLNSLNRLRIPPISDKPSTHQFKHPLSTTMKKEALLTSWPSWVYDQYDIKLLSNKIHEFLQFLCWRGAKIPKDPAALSFWVAQNLIIAPKIALALLGMNCVVQRLQYEVKLLSESASQYFICKQCRVIIAKQTDVLQMNEEGLQSAYCNAAGVVHETITVSNAQSLILNQEPPSTMYSWFPGYAWTIACCSHCGLHMGWKFTATNSDLKPSSFWGLIRNALLWGGKKYQCYDQWNPDEIETDDEDDENFEIRRSAAMSRSNLRFLR